MLNGNFAPLDDLVLTCASDDDCPDNFFCETRLDPPECLELANRDVEAPSLEERSVLPTIAKERTILHAYFTVSEPLSADGLQVFWVTAAELAF